MTEIRAGLVSTQVVNHHAVRDRPDKILVNDTVYEELLAFHRDRALSANEGAVEQPALIRLTNHDDWPPGTFHLGPFVALTGVVVASKLLLTASQSSLFKR